MKLTMLAAAALGLLLAGDAIGDGAAAKEVESALRDLNTAFAKQDAGAMRRLIADDQVSVTSYGGMMDRETLLKSLADWKVTEFKDSDLKVTVLTKDAARATFRLAMKGTYKGKPLPAKSYVVSVWVNRGGKWQEASYQESPAGDD
jgi:hypothetical protein